MAREEAGQFLVGDAGVGRVRLRCFLCELSAQAEADDLELLVGEFEQACSQGESAIQVRGQRLRNRP